MENTRNLALVMAFSGCRVSDLGKVLDPKNLVEHKGMNFIQFVAQKTGKGCVIPVTKPLAEILAKNPQKISDQKLNQNIKKLMKAVFGESLVVNVEGHQIDLVTETTNHVFRHSFVTNFASLDYLSLDVIAVATGHVVIGGSEINGYNHTSLVKKALKFRKLLSLCHIEDMASIVI